MSPDRYSPPRPITVRRQVAAAMLGEGLSKLDELISRGQIEAKKSGKNLLIVVDSLERYVAGLPRAVLKSSYPAKKPARLLADSAEVD